MAAHLNPYANGACTKRTGFVGRDILGGPQHRERNDNGRSPMGNFATSPRSELAVDFRHTVRDAR